MSKVLGSVVIPAHNESSVILRCLENLLEGFDPGELDVVVACNGCTDGTAEIARSFDSGVRVVEIEAASKPVALRAAEELSATYPRIYLDADVILTSSSARQLLARLSSGRVLAARPPIEYYTANSAALVRAYYRARMRIPSVHTALWGAGAYGLSEGGRQKFGAFPDLIGDDLYVDRQFGRNEIEIIETAPVVVYAPRTVADLVRILRRQYHGNCEFSSLNQSGAPTDGSRASISRDLLWLASTGARGLIDATAYITLAVAARATLRVAMPRTWQRDNSSRAG